MTNALKCWYNNVNLFLTLLQLKQVQQGAVKIPLS